MKNLLNIIINFFFYYIFKWRLNVSNLITISLEGNDLHFLHFLKCGNTNYNISFWELKSSKKKDCFTKKWNQPRRKNKHAQDQKPSSTIRCCNMETR